MQDVLIDIVESKVELRGLNRDASPLKYFSICEDNSGRLIGRFGLGDRFVIDTFERYTGVSLNKVADLDLAIVAYGKALKKDIAWYRGNPVSKNNDLYSISQGMLRGIQALDKKRHLDKK